MPWQPSEMDEKRALRVVDRLRGSSGGLLRRGRLSRSGLLLGMGGTERRKGEGCAKHEGRTQCHWIPANGAN